MKFHLLFKGLIINALLVAATAIAASSDKTIIEAVRKMERARGLKITRKSDVADSIRRTQQGAGNYTLFGPAISPDGNTIAWSDTTALNQLLKLSPDTGEKCPFLTVQSLKEGKQPVWVEGRFPTKGLGISADGKVTVVVAFPNNPNASSRLELLAIDRRSGVVVHDLTPFITQFVLGSNERLGNDLEEISVSGPGTLVALGTPQKMQVLEIPSGRTVYVGQGRFPRLSPDGKRLAFVNDDKLWIHSFADGSTSHLDKIKGIKGIGGWSPDGRFLLAGAWTKWPAFEKRQIIVDTSTGNYAVIGRLGDGDYGTKFVWVSDKLLKP